MLCLENLPQLLKKLGEMGRKMCAGKRRIFSNGLGKIFIKNLPQHLKKLSEREEKEGERKKNNRGEGHIFKAEYFKLLI